MKSETAAPGGVLDVLHILHRVAAVADELVFASWQTLTSPWTPVPRLSLQGTVHLTSGGKG
eukprot:6175465-Pleurochrysis_carterae.AAC.1